MKRKIQEIKEDDDDSWDDMECNLKLTVTLANETLANIALMKKRKTVEKELCETEQQRITDSCIHDDNRIFELGMQNADLLKSLQQTRQWLADVTHYLQDKDPLVPCKCDAHVLKPYW